jgi:hypothetical protein
MRYCVALAPEGGSGLIMNDRPSCDRAADVTAAVALFAAEFPAYDFRIQQTSGGISLVAVRRRGADEPGVYAVITPDPAEMRNALKR